MDLNQSDDEHLLKLKQFGLMIGTGEDQNYLVNQFQMIVKQNQFLQQIRDQISKKKLTPNHEILFGGSSPTAMNLLMDSSFDVSNISGLQAYDDQPFKTKFGEEFEKSLLASALNQLQENCSPSTYDVIRNCVLGSKQKQFQLVTQKHNKLAKRYQQLQTTFIIKSTQLVQTETQLRDALIKFEQFDQQKRRFKLKVNQLSEKQKRIFKLQSSIVFKEKLFHEGKKRYERQKNIFLSIQQRLNELYKKMENIWQQITEKMDQSAQVSCFMICENKGENSCWKKQVMRKCKQQLIEQRQLLRQEEQEVEKEFELIQSLSEQVKNFLNQKESSSDQDPFTAQPSSIIFDRK